MGTGFVARVLSVVQQFLCGLHGHDALLHFETGRLSMRCTSCGYETPGWDLKSSRPAAANVVETKGRVLRLPLRERRVA